MKMLTNGNKSACLDCHEPGKAEYTEEDGVYCGDCGSLRLIDIADGSVFKPEFKEATAADVWTDDIESCDHIFRE